MYQAAILEIIDFQNDDIITTSESISYVYE